MKTLLTTIFTVLLASVFTAQSISYDEITSNNILAFYRQQQGSPVMMPQSADIIMQHGDSNVAIASDAAPQYLELIQSGNYNTTLYNNQNNYPTNAQIHVRGSGNYIDITGSNSISDGMQININANDMTIFMRNY